MAKIIETREQERARMQRNFQRLLDAIDAQKEINSMPKYTTKVPVSVGLVAIIGTVYTWVFSIANYIA
tara:strand:+ start:372 stop:575 length:204 start_codon:yes stop_codon:yes gene_type:complete